MVAISVIITKTLLSCTWPPRWPPTRWRAPSPEWLLGALSCPSMAAPRMPANTCQKVRSLFFCLYHIRCCGNIQISPIYKVFLSSLLGNQKLQIVLQLLERRGVLSVDSTFLGDCPTEEGEALVYDMEIPIENFFPTIEILGRLSHMLHWHITLPPDRTQPQKLCTANFSSGTFKTLIIDYSG